MKMQYGGARSGTRRQGSRGNVYIYSGSYRRLRKSRRSVGCLAPTPARQKMESVAAFFGLPVVRSRFGCVLLIAVGLVVLSNFVCAVIIGGVESEIIALQGQQVELESTNIHLLARRAVAWGPDNFTKLAGEKLELYPAEKGQYRLYNRYSGTFQQ